MAFPCLLAKRFLVLACKQKVVYYLSVVENKRKGIRNKMENSILLYVVNIANYDNDSFGGVGASDIARWLGCSVPTARKRLRELCEFGVIVENKKSAKIGHGFKYHYTVTKKGAEVLAKDGAVIGAQFKAWQNAKLIALLENARKVSKNNGKKIKRAKNQMELF